MKPIVTLLRPKQWVKNAFVLAPLFFSLEFLDAAVWPAALWAVLSFVLMSSAVYVLNDISDAEADRHHPDKKTRPIAAGQVSVPLAVLLMLVLLLAGAGVAFVFLPRECSAVLAVYAVMNLAYSRGLKHVAILDVTLIAVGYVLRVLMGGYAIAVAISPWIVLATFVLALFLGFGKRRHELRLESDQIRPSLDAYNRPLLDKLINVSCGAALMCYAIYAAETAQALGKVELIYTVAFVAFGLFRYLQFIYFDREGGAPELILYQDRWFVLNLALWLLVTLGVLMG